MSKKGSNPPPPKGITKPPPPPAPPRKKYDGGISKTLEPSKKLITRKISVDENDKELIATYQSSGWIIIGSKSYNANSGGAPGTQDIRNIFILSKKVWDYE